MSALTVALGADIPSLKRAMASATELGGASARRMGKLSGAGLAGLGKGGMVAMTAGLGAATLGAATAVGVA